MRILVASFALGFALALAGVAAMMLIDEIRAPQYSGWAFVRVVFLFGVSIFFATQAVLVLL